jgi:hypothetical protein
MTNASCPDCGHIMRFIRGGTRAYGSGPGELPRHGIPTVASCDDCGDWWERDYGDEGPWRRHDGQNRTA